MPFRSPDNHAITPQGRGRFPGFDVLTQVDHWDDVTAGAVLARLSFPTGLSFFTPQEVAVAAPLLDLLLAQDSEPRVPVLELIDQRLALDETDGWHYDRLPQDGDAWRQTLTFLDADARARFGRAFADLGRAAQATLVQTVQDAAGDWHGLPAAHVWSLWTRYACTAFYSHPAAWAEIGFPGPAYPRGYKNAGVGTLEPFEVPDARPAIDPVRMGD